MYWNVRGCHFNFYFYSTVSRTAQPCDSSPCKNGGTCRNDKNKFTCKCIGMFEGVTCAKKGTIYILIESESLIRTYDCEI